MPRTDISLLPDESRIWIFPISPALDDARAADVVSRVDAFLESWVAHNLPIVSARDLIDGTFLVIAVDRQSETSGCSIDRMFGVLQSLEHQHGVAILDPNRIFRRASGGTVESVSREAFRESGRGDTPVFDILSERLGDIRSGRWEKPAAQSWHSALLNEGQSKS